MRGTNETDGEMRMRTYVPFWLLAAFSCRVLVAPDGVMHMSRRLELLIN